MKTLPLYSLRHLDEGGFSIMDHFKVVKSGGRRPQGLGFKNRLRRFPIPSEGEGLGVSVPPPRWSPYCSVLTTLRLVGKGSSQYVTSEGSLPTFDSFRLR